MKWMILCLCLSGCAQFPPNSHQLLDMLQADAANRVNTFNKLRSANLPIPKVVLTNLGDTDGQEDYAIIEIDYSHCVADIEDCLDDTIPHELGHEAVDLLAPEDSYQTFSNGHITIHHESSDGSHGGQWCDAMRAFGGVPEKHGYCHASIPKPAS